ncbi:unnamed protein product [Closterium sp. NIES-65]|nr:unnamed protein product [Closterium sp. NIES-65]
MSISVKDLDPAFQGLSNKPGLDVWRLDQGQVVAVPKADHGKFFTKDAYIVLKTSGSKHGGAVTYAIHYWLGKSTTQDDAAMAAIKTVDLDAALGGKAAQYRETQGHESDLLLSYFRPCIIATPGSWGKPDPEASQPRLLQVKGRRFIHVRQVAVARSSLSHSEIFVLDTRSKLFQFTGANASKQERVKGMEVMQLLQDSVYGGKAPIAIIDDGKLDDPESNEFWDMFGGFAPIAKKSQGEDDVEVKPTPPTLYWSALYILHCFPFPQPNPSIPPLAPSSPCQSPPCPLANPHPVPLPIPTLSPCQTAPHLFASPLLVRSSPPTPLPLPLCAHRVSGDGLQEVGAGALKKLQLEGNKCYLVDMGPTVFVWFGRISSLDERRAACIAAETQLVVGKKPPSVRVVRMPERFELTAFKACFSDWPVVPVLGGGEGGNKLKAMLKQSGVVDKAAPKGAAGGSDEHPPLAETPGDLKVRARRASPPPPFFLPSVLTPPLITLRSSSLHRLLFSPLLLPCYCPPLLPSSPPLLLHAPPPPLLRFSPPPGFPSSPPHILPSSPSPLLPSARLPACSSSPPLLLPPPLVLSALPPRLHQQAWRVAGSTKAAVAAEEVGKFHAGESYLVQHTSIRDRKHEYLLFLWLGKDTSAADRTAATALAVRTMDGLRGNVTLVRVVQGREPEQFLSLFKNHLLFLKGKAAEAYDAAGIALFRVRARDNGLILAVQMDTVPRSLNSSECMLLQTPANPFLWVGKNSTEADKAAATTAAEIFKPGVALKQLAEGKETSVFWGHLGAKGDYPAQREQREAQRDARLFHYTGTAAAAKVVEVPNYEQEDLISEDVMLLDTHSEVFVWVGVNLPDKDKKDAFEYAQRYVEQVAGSEGRSKEVTIIRVVEGFEPPMFTTHFHWDPTKTAAFVDPHERKLAHLQGREVELSDAAKRKLATLGLASSHPAAAAGAAAGGAAAAPADAEPVAAAPPAEVVAAAAAHAAKDSASSQMAAAMAALKGSIRGVPTKPEPAAASPAAAAPAPIATPEPAPAEEVAAPMSAASQRAAAIAALSGTLTAEKRKSGGGAAYSIPKVQSPAATARSPSSTPEPQPAASPAAVTPSSPVPAPIPEGDEPSDAAGTEAAVEGAVYALERLTVNSTDPAPGIDTKKREAYLSDADFLQAFGCDKEAFYKQPKWKQDTKKRSLHLF